VYTGSVHLVSVAVAKLAADLEKTRRVGEKIPVASEQNAPTRVRVVAEISVGQSSPLLRRSVPSLATPALL
jgi:hypothetical protein